MLPVLLSLIGGILVGILVHKYAKINPFLQKSITLATYLLLFTLGLNAGLNKNIMSQLQTLGITALLISTFAIAGSIGAAWAVYRFFYKSKSS